MVVPVFLRGHLFNRNHAAMQLLAAGVFELDGGVGDAEVLLEHVVEIDQDAGALRRRNVGDADVAGQGAGLRAQAPDVQVVDVDDALDGLHAGADLRQRAIARRALQQDMRRLARDFGLLVGPSSGANMVVARRLLEELPEGSTIVTVLCDEGEKYLSEYFIPASMTS